MIGRFIEEVCTTTGEVRAKTIYSAYRDWCAASGERYVTQKKFGQSIEKRGYEKRTSDGVRYVGIWCPTPAKIEPNGSKNPEPSEPLMPHDKGASTQRDILDG